VRWSEPGYLRRSYVPVDGKPAYALESSTGQARLYVQPLPGVNLELYLNRNVYLYGTMSYRPELRNNYMAVAQVQQLP
jgi:hypothetical protein